MPHLVPHLSRAKPTLLTWTPLRTLPLAAPQALLMALTLGECLEQCSPPPGPRTEIKTPQPDPFLPAQGARQIQLQGGQLPLLLAWEGKAVRLTLPLKEDPEHQFAHPRQLKGPLRPTPTSLERALLLQHPLPQQDQEALPPRQPRGLARPTLRSITKVIQPALALQTSAILKAGVRRGMSRESTKVVQLALVLPMGPPLRRE